MSVALGREIYTGGGINDGARRDDGVIELHTHDRINFKRCRQKWDFSSGLRKHLVPIGASNSNLWFGSGIHYALEDYHGWRRWPSPAAAFEAYHSVYAKHYPSYLPIDHEELLELGTMMLEYYPTWLARRDEYKTVWMDGKPLVEVEFSIEIPELTAYAGTTVVYQGAADRIVEDSDGNLWVQDYKSVKTFDTHKLELDPQITAYCWALEIYLGRPIEGMLYLQMKKVAPEYPKVLAKGGLSTDKRQHTTYELFKLALLEQGYDLNELPSKYSDFLNLLLEQETVEGDRFIRWDKVYRNEHYRQSEYELIVAEGYDMLDKNLRIYPNPTRDCSMCEYSTPCLAIRDGSDLNWILQNMYVKKGDTAEWRKKLEHLTAQPQSALLAK